MFTARQSISALAALALLIALAAFVGYGAGIIVGGGPRMSETTVFRNVPAYSGDAEVSASVGAITYGVSGAVPWVDRSGSFHGSGWPACVPPRSAVRITFGGAMIYGPTGTGDYRILWVDCRN